MEHETNKTRAKKIRIRGVTRTEASEEIGIGSPEGAGAEAPAGYGSKTDRQERIAGWKQSVLRDARVAVIGAGALGNELLKNLALSGVRYAFIADMDDIEMTNLSRTVLFSEEDLGRMKAEAAAEKFLGLNVCEGAKADRFVGDACTGIGSGVLNHVDVVVGCLDNEQTRYEMNRRASLVGKPYIDAGIASLTANVTCVMSGENAPCWACAYGAANADEVKKRLRAGCLNAKKKAAATGHAATTQVTSAVAAGIQCQEVIKCLHAMKSGTMRFAPGRKYIFDGEYNSFNTLRLARNPECADHERFEHIEETPIASDWTLERTLRYVNERCGEGYFLNVENDDRYCFAGYADKAYCLHCGREIAVGKPLNAVTEDDYYCEECEHVQLDLDRSEPVLYFALCEEQAHLFGLTLRELGIPALHILVFENEDPEKPDLHLEMTGDLKTIMPNL